MDKPYANREVSAAVSVFSHVPNIFGDAVSSSFPVEPPPSIHTDLYRFSLTSPKELRYNTVSM